MVITHSVQSNLFIKHNINHAFGSALSELSLEPNEVAIQANQVHGSHKIQYTSAMDKGQYIDKTLIPVYNQFSNEIGEADAIETVLENRIIAIRTADCAPILVADKKGSIVMGIHSGWKGTLLNISGLGIQNLLKNSNLSPQDLLVAIGPCISQKRLELGRDIGEEFTQSNPYYKNFIKPSPTDIAKCYLDMSGIIVYQLQSLGIPKDQIDIIDICTFDTPEYNSYRKNNNTERQWSFIWKSSP